VARMLWPFSWRSSARPNSEAARSEFVRSARRGRLIQRTELQPESFVPYVRHVDDRTIALQSGAVMRMWTLEGTIFETVEPQLLGNYHEALNEVWRSLDDPRVAAWQHTIRSREVPPIVTKATTPFGRALDAGYMSRLQHSVLRRNELVVSLVVLPGGIASTGLAAAFKPERAVRAVEPVDLEILEEMSVRLEAGLRLYRPTALAVYDTNGALYSGPAEALHVILTGERGRVPLTMGDLGRSLIDTRLIFGPTAIEFRGVSATRYGGMLSVGEYPAMTRPGALKDLLSANFDFVLTQSFKRLSKDVARELMTRRQNQFKSAGDKALAQRDALTAAASRLEDNEFALGQHHLSLLVYGDTLERLRQSLAEGRRLLGNGGIMAKREDLSLIHTFFAQQPGAMAFRVRKAEGITSRNLAALGPMWSYPRGRRRGLHWDAPVAELKTASGGRYAFSYHVRDVGHSLILGMTGSGKSVLLNFSLAGLLKLGGRAVLFDKDRSSELFVGMMGGRYSSIRRGRPTGAAPFKAADTYTDRYRAFLGQLLARLVSEPNVPLTSEEHEEVKNAVAAMELVPRENRSLEAVGMQLGLTLRRRLERWMQGGELGWALDAEEDTIAAGFESDPIVGVDITELLRAGDVREPLLMYLFEKLDAVVGTGRLIWVVEEFHAALADREIRKQVDDALRTWRKRNGMAILVSQSPSDAARSEIAATLLQQTATKISLPNPSASRDDYVRDLQYGEREYEVVSKLSPMSRRFLVKQVDPDADGNVVSGVVCELDLQGLDDVLAVLSPSAERGDFARWDAVKALPLEERWDAFVKGRRA
jgi:type IV secretion system protein VirB4